MRPGFKPDKSAESWIGRKVFARPDAGWWTGASGIVLSEELWGDEHGWFNLIPDDPYGRMRYPEGIIGHTSEFYSPNNPSLAK